MGKRASLVGEQHAEREGRGVRMGLFGNGTCMYLPVIVKYHLKLFISFVIIFFTEDFHICFSQWCAFTRQFKFL